MLNEVYHFGNGVIDEQDRTTTSGSQFYWHDFWHNWMTQSLVTNQWCKKSKRAKRNHMKDSAEDSSEHTCFDRQTMSDRLETQKLQMKPAKRKLVGAEKN